MDKEKKQDALTEEEVSIFHQQVNSYKPEAQEYISDLSSNFLEADVYRKIKNDPDAVKQISEKLRGVGLLDKDVDLVMHYFNIPFESHPTV